MKAKDLIAILEKDPDREVIVALGSFRVDEIKSAEAEEKYIQDMSKPPVKTFTLYPVHYKSVETKGVDYV